MYTKVFRSIYDGTLADNWQAMVTFQQMLILADAQGVVDMTIGSIARITGIPLEILQAGIAVLEAPDSGSRTPEMEGRRIARLDAHRDWGWFLVNFAKYRAMQSREEKNEADRERMRTKRAAERSNVSQGVALCSVVSHGVASVADVAHTDTDTYTDKKQKHVASATRFDEFWLSYPTKVGRKPCVKIWSSKRLDQAADRIVSDVRARIASDRKWREGYIPNPATYLTQERWNDEIQTAGVGSDEDWRKFAV